LFREYDKGMSKECEGVQPALDELRVRHVELIDELDRLRFENGRIRFVNWLIPRSDRFDASAFTEFYSMIEMCLKYDRSISEEFGEP